MRKVGMVVAVVLAALAATLAIPLEEWRTGDQKLMPLDYAPVPSAAKATRRIWIDTDAACGHSPRTDPDDCLAILALARRSDLRIEGISTVAGNAPLEVVDEVAAALAGQLGLEVRARRSLIQALEAGPLTLVALGPLTNLAAVLDARPDLRPRIQRLIAVMGRRPGHIFHPAENAGGGMLFGHGPVFRDFNFAKDEAAAAQVIAMRLPTTLIPYDAARGLELTARDLEVLAAAGGAGAWVAQRARGWLQYWREDIGRDGFFPFDLLAAAYVVAPEEFRCTHARASISEDTTLFIPFWRPMALLVDRGARPLENARAVAPVLYCGRATGELKAALVH